MRDEPVKLVCFDLGRVLIRICDNWKHACERAGVAVPTTELDAAGKAAIMDVVIRHEIGRIEQEDFCREAAVIFGLNIDQVRALSDSYLIEPYPGVTELIADLKAAGMKTACLSNTNGSHWRIMNDPASPCFLPLHELDYRFASQEIGARKPDQAIYEHVEKAAGYAGGSIAFFDDLQVNIDAATQRGWQAFLIAHDGDPVSQARRHLRELDVLH